MDATLYPSESIPPVGQFVLDGIASGSIWVHLQYHDSASANICKVQFAKATTRIYQEDYFFTVTLARQIPRRTPMLLLFPVTRDVLDLSKTRSLEAINGYIDEHLGKDPKVAQMVVCLGGVMYKMDGITGRLYMQWAQILEYVSDRHPNRWSETPVFASTDGHFKMTGLFPVFGQHMLQRFIHPDCSTFYVPRGYVVWHLDKARPTRSLEHEAMHTATVENRAQRDMIPDHEVSKYQRRPPRAPEQAVTQEDIHSLHVQRARAVEASTTSDDYEPIVVTISELPTPRPFAPTNAAASVLDSGFFDLDDTSDSQSSPSLSSQATPRPSSYSAWQDFNTSRPVHEEEMRSLTNMLNSPLLGLYSSPKDSQALRKAPKSGPGE
jgi:hypothetical protein